MKRGKIKITNENGNHSKDIFDHAKTPSSKRKHLFTLILNFTFGGFRLNSFQTFLTTVYEDIFRDVLTDLIWKV